MDIMEIQGKPMAKRGKWSGAKEILRCRKCGSDKIVPLKGVPKQEIGNKKCTCGGSYEALLQPLIKKGKVARKLPKPKVIRGYVAGQLKNFSIG
jgi:nicotinate phosphoribosyltransferase